MSHIYNLATNARVDPDDPDAEPTEHFEHFIHASAWREGKTTHPPHPGIWQDCDLYHVGDHYRGRPDLVEWNRLHPEGQVSALNAAIDKWNRLHPEGRVRAHRAALTPKEPSDE